MNRLTSHSNTPITSSVRTTVTSGISFAPITPEIERHSTCRLSVREFQKEFSGSLWFWFIGTRRPGPKLDRHTDSASHPSFQINREFRCATMNTAASRAWRLAWMELEINRASSELASDSFFGVRIMPTAIHGNQRVGVFRTPGAAFVGAHP